MKHETTLILFCGLPGSGKTRIAKQLETQTDAIRLCTDDWMADLDIDLHDESFRDLLQHRLYILAKELLAKGVDVILEDGLWSKKERDEKRADARRLGAAVQIHVFDLSPEEQWRRLEHRNNHPAHGTAAVTHRELQSYFKLFELPTKEELRNFDQVFVYKDSDPLKIA